jgi:predicted RNase H-like HicB family nuclease
MDSGVFHIIKGGIIYELEPEDEGGYVISVPALPGCISTGDTIEHALEMIAEAMELWLEVAREKGFAIPTQFDLLQQAC